MAIRVDGRARGASRSRKLVAVLVVAAAGFIVASLLLARALSGAGVERSRIADLVDAQARGDQEEVLALLPACRAEPACARLSRARTRELRRGGAVAILAFQPSVRLTPTGSTGSARVAWRAGSGPPVVQCVRVRREGPLDGGGVELLSISDPIPSTGSCPSG